MKESVSKKSYTVVFSIILALLLGTSLAFMFSNFEKAQAADGTLVIAIDPGHGGTDGGAQGNGYSEKVINWNIAVACVDELNTYYGVRAVLTRSWDDYVSLQGRIDNAYEDGASVVVSMHCNSGGGGSAHGSEVWAQNNTAYNNHLHASSTGLGNAILKQLTSQFGFSNRGVKYRTDPVYYWWDDSSLGLQDYYGINRIARYNNMTAIIVEHGFIDNYSDAQTLNSNAAAIGKADALGIANYYGLSKYDASVTKTGEAVETTVVTQGGPAVMGSAKVTAEQMASWYNSKSSVSYPTDVYASRGAATIQDFAQACLDAGAKEGVRGDIIFVQAMLETGWLGFNGSSVKAEYCNFGGIGATDTNPNANHFSSVHEGLLAQAQHLKGYSSTAALNETCVDPRFQYLSSKRGIAPTLDKYGNGTWATDPDYGKKLTNLICSLTGEPLTTGDSATSVKFNVSDVALGSTVFVDGVEQTISKSGNYATVSISENSAHVITAYTMKTGSNSHTTYPTGMETWLVKYSDGKFTTTRFYGMDNLLQYAGTSIRITGNKGIRVTTGMPEQTKGALNNSGISGYTLQEVGTVMCLSTNVGDADLTLDLVSSGKAKKGTAYVRGSKNVISSRTGGVEYYNNVLVGFSTADHCKAEIKMRPYAILNDGSGNQVTVYGGEIERSILYVAQQNVDDSSLSASAKAYLQDIISMCS